MLSCVPQFQTSPTCWGELRRFHMSLSFRPFLLDDVSFGAVMCLTALDLTSLLRWASSLPHVLSPWTSTPCWCEHRRCHVSLGFGRRLLAEMSSGAVMYLTTPDSVFLRGELRYCNVSHDPRWAMDHRDKERLSCPSTQLVSRVFKAHSCVTEAPVRRACHYSAAL
jgi:hypothetical protein